MAKIAPNYAQLLKDMKHLRASAVHPTKKRPATPLQKPLPLPSLQISHLPDRHIIS